MAARNIMARPILGSPRFSGPAPATYALRDFCRGDGRQEADLYINGQPVAPAVVTCRDCGGRGCTGGQRHAG